MRSGLVGDGRRSFPPEVVVEVKALACQLPAELGLLLSRLHVPDIRSEVMRRGIVATVSDATVWRWLHEDVIRPWTYRSWIFPRDPDFEAKASRVLDLYASHSWLPECRAAIPSTSSSAPRRDSSWQC